MKQGLILEAEGLTKKLALRLAKERREYGFIARVTKRKNGYALWRSSSQNRRGNKKK